MSVTFYLFRKVCGVCLQIICNNDIIGTIESIKYVFNYKISHLFDRVTQGIFIVEYFIFRMNLNVDAIRKISYTVNYCLYYTYAKCSSNLLCLSLTNTIIPSIAANVFNTDTEQVIDTSNFLMH